MVSKKILVLSVLYLTGIMGITQVGFTFAVSAEKIPLVQQYEQFPAQEVIGFCMVNFDVEGNLHWQIKVNGLIPGTEGLFDLGHWAGDHDVTYTADKEGNANSDNQTILAADIPHPIFTQFAACHVYTDRDNHTAFPGIATAEIGII